MSKDEIARNYTKRYALPHLVYGGIMTRMSKNSERRGVSPRRPKVPGKKTGARKDNLATGYKPHPNALSGTSAELALFFPKVPNVKSRIR